MKRVERVFNLISHNLFTYDGTLDYDRITESIILLCEEINKIDDDESESLWSIGEHGECSLDNLIVGAYWHYTEWHDGQWGKGYAALSALGGIFSPGCTSLDDDSLEYFAYEMLESLALKEGSIKT